MKSWLSFLRGDPSILVTTKSGSIYEIQNVELGIFLLETLASLEKGKRTHGIATPG